MNNNVDVNQKTKKKINFTALLKLLSVPVFMLLAYPIIALINGFFSDNKQVDVGQSALLLFIVILSGVLGFILHGYENKVHKKNNNMKFMLKAGIRVGLFLFVLVPMFFVILLHENYATIIYIIVTIAGYVFGFIFQNKHYSEILTKKMLYIYVAIDAVVVLVLLLLKIQHSQMWFIMTYFIFAGVYFVVKNQSNIDYLMERRQHKLEHLPKKIRYYNLYLILGVLGVALIGFIARKPLSKLLIMMYEFIRQVIAAIWKFILWLSSLNKGGEVGGSSEPSSESQLPFIKEETTGTFDPTFIIVALMIIGVIVLIVKNRKAIGRFFTRIMGQIKAAIRKLLVNTPLDFSKADESTDYYYDEVQDISKNDIIKVKKQKLFSEKDFKKQYKQYVTMQDNMSKMVFGYRLIIKWFSIKGIDVTDTDTTLEILQKVIQKDIIVNDSFTEVTNVYNYIKFGNISFTKQSLNELSKTLSQIK